MKTIFLILFFTISFQAQAFVQTCVYSDQLGKIEARFTLTGADLEVVTSELTDNGQAVPSVESHCSNLDVPGRQAFLCSHRSLTGERFDLYPEFSTNGRITTFSLVDWTSSGPQQIVFNSCH